MKIFKSLIINLFIVIGFQNVMAENTTSDKITPHTVITSSTHPLANTNSLFDDSDNTSFYFEEDDVKLWIEYNYDYSRLSNIFFRVTDPEDMNLTIEIYRNDFLLKTYTTRIYHNMLKQKTLNFIIPDEFISDKVIIYNRSSR